MSRSKLKKISLGEIVFVEKNANFMEQSKFNQLVENIKRDGELTTVPFTILLENGKNAGKYEVISGNHRVKAAQMAGLSQIFVMYVPESQITNDEKRAIQISHNSIHGQDDLEILHELMDEIKDAAMKEYAAVDESIFEDLQKMDYDIIQPSNEIVNFNMTFFESDLEDIEALCQEIEDNGDIENTVLMPKEKMYDFLKIVSAVQEKYSIKALGLTILKIAELAKEQLSVNVES